MNTDHEKHNVCISVPKVFDWVTRQVDLPTACYHEGNKSGSDLSELFKCRDSEAESFTEFIKQFPKCEAVCRVIESEIYTKEVTDPHNRMQVEVCMPNGEEVTLEKVKILIKVSVDVDLYDEAGNHICTSCEPFEFTKVETFYLCAPEGTEVCAFVTAGQCDAELIFDGSYMQLDLSFSFCLDVHVLADVLLEIEAAYCKPRLEFPISDVLCKETKFPPQCPTLFPGKKSKSHSKSAS